MKYQDDDKHDIFTQEKITILLWLLNKSCLLKQKKNKEKWFGISLGVYVITRTLHDRLEILKR